MSQRQPPPVEAGPYRSHCAIARTLDLLGDKWTLLVLRDALFFDVSTFAGFCQRPEQVPTNLLAARLKKLVAAGADGKSRLPAAAHPLPVPTHCSCQRADTGAASAEAVRRQLPTGLNTRC